MTLIRFEVFAPDFVTPLLFISRLTVRFRLPLASPFGNSVPLRQFESDQVRLFRLRHPEKNTVLRRRSRKPALAMPLSVAIGLICLNSGALASTNLVQWSHESPIRVYAKATENLQIVADGNGSSISVDTLHAGAPDKRSSDAEASKEKKDQADRGGTKTPPTGAQTSESNKMIVVPRPAPKPF